MHSSRDDGYIANPREVFEEYYGIPHPAPHPYRLGIVAMALEIYGTIQTLERLPVAQQPHEVIAALMTILQNYGVEVQVAEMYERLAEWRKPKFVAERESLPLHTDVAERPFGRPTSPAASALASPEEVASRRGKKPLLPQQRRALLASFESEALEPSSEAESTMPDE